MSKPKSFDHWILTLISVVASLIDENGLKCEIKRCFNIREGKKSLFDELRGLAFSSMTFSSQNFNQYILSIFFQQLIFKQKLLIDCFYPLSFQHQFKQFFDPSEKQDNASPKFQLFIFNNSNERACTYIFLVDILSFCFSTNQIL